MKIYRGSTPTLIFNLPFATTTLKGITATFVQVGNIIFEKEINDCTLEDNKIKIDLTQQETLQLNAGSYLIIQLKVKTSNDKVLPTKPQAILVENVYNEEVM